MADWECWYHYHVPGPTSSIGGGALGSGAISSSSAPAGGGVVPV